MTEAHTFERKILLGKRKQFSKHLLIYTSTFDLVLIVSIILKTNAQFFNSEILRKFKSIEFFPNRVHRWIKELTTLVYLVHTYSLYRAVRSKYYNKVDSLKWTPCAYTYILFLDALAF